ncbi:hypothetical protein Tco_0153648 [Tanacetum coccineum]
MNGVAKTNLDESSRALGEATSSRDSSLIALQTKQTELEKYTALNDLTSEYKILQTKLNDTLGLLAIKDIDIQKGLKTKTYEISVVNQKHDELVKKSLLNRSQFEGQLKEKSKVISDLKVKEGKELDYDIEMELTNKKLMYLLLSTRHWKLEIERLLRAVVSQDIMSIVQFPSVVDSSNLQTELDRTKERLENSYNDMQQMIKRLQAQLGDLKGKSKDTPCVSNTLDPLSHKLENENVELEFQTSQPQRQRDSVETSSLQARFSRTKRAVQIRQSPDRAQDKMFFPSAEKTDSSQQGLEFLFRRPYTDKDQPSVPRIIEVHWFRPALDSLGEQPQLPTSVVPYRVSTRGTYYTLNVGVLQRDQQE